MTFAILSSLGKTPWISDKFKICVSECTYISMELLTTEVVISSHPGLQHFLLPVNLQALKI